jgi:hypothetical protein
MPFDAQPTPTLRPGERLLHGAVEIYSLDLLNAHLADRAIEQAPADLTGLSYDDLNALCLAYLNRVRRVRDAETEAFGSRVCGERASRPEYRSVYGRAA